MDTALNRTFLGQSQTIQPARIIPAGWQLTSDTEKVGSAFNLPGRFSHGRVLFPSLQQRCHQKKLSRSRCCGSVSSKSSASLLLREDWSALHSSSNSHDKGCADSPSERLFTNILSVCQPSVKEGSDACCTVTAPAIMES